MRKYLEVAKILFKAQLSWRFDIAFNMIFITIKILFAFIIWGAVFGEHKEVAGFNFNTMLSYYIISSFLSQLEMSEGVSGEISGRIRNGSFSKYMVIPVKIEGYFLAQTFGAAALHMIFNLIAAIVWVFIFHIRFTVTNDPFLILSAALMVILGLVFMVQLNFFIGILAFKFQDIGLFLMIKGNIVVFVTGTMIPLILLPGVIQSVMRLFPFYYVTYLPSMLFIGRNAGEILIGLLTLSLWMLAFVFINKISYGRLRRKYDGVGI